LDTGRSNNTWSEVDRGAAASLLDMVSFVLVVADDDVMTLLAELNPDTFGMSMTDNRRTMNTPMDFVLLMVPSAYEDLIQVFRGSRLIFKC
jgi:hypothetical protein